nr:MAG TPA: repressor domain protein [Caudoviricetes sp.]
MELQIFSNEEFGEIRTIEIDGKPYFVATDVATALGYVNPRKAISDHCKGVTKRDTPTSSGVQQMSYINEGDLYRLIMKSKLPSAEKFESWVMDEVLPSIRKTGSYSKPLTTSEQIRLLAQGNTELTERVDKVEDKITSIEEETPLYGCEIEEVQKHVRKKGIEVLGGKDSNAYKDGGIRGSVYSDIYKQLKREFGCVATYKSIKRKYLADVHEFIDTYLLPIALAEVVHDTNM